MSLASLTAFELFVNFGKCALIIRYPDLGDGLGTALSYAEMRRS